MKEKAVSQRQPFLLEKFFHKKTCKQKVLSLQWRDGRVVDCGGLENR